LATTGPGLLRRWRQIGYAKPNTAPQRAVYRIWPTCVALNSPRVARKHHSLVVACFVHVSGLGWEPSIAAGPDGGLFSLRSPSCLAQAHRCLSSLQSHRGTASSWGQSLRGSFLGLIRIAQIIPIEIVWTQISPLRWRLGAPLGRIPRYCFATVAARWHTSST
jgi:hypothetical protein